MCKADGLLTISDKSITKLQLTTIAFNIYVLQVKKT